jgi:dCTP deaminase
VSVVPFVLQGDHRSIITKQEDFLLDEACVLIQELDMSQIDHEHDANTSYDLRVGSEYRDHRDNHKTELGEKESIELLPGAAVIIQTKESVHFPRYKFGQILPKVGLLQLGVTNTTSKVDPGYNGYLLITVFNLGKKPVKLKHGEKFCSLVIQNVTPGAKVYNKSSKRIEGSKNANWGRNLYDSIERNAGMIATACLLVTAIMTVIQLFK